MNRERLTNIDVIHQVAEQNSFKLFEGNKREYNLNIWNIRSNVREAGKFDDIQMIFYKNIVGRWVIELFNITTDPSELSLMNMQNPKGVAVIKKGQYFNAWTYGKHKGQYDALIQIGNITVIRDFNKDEILNIPDDVILKYWSSNTGCSIIIKRSNDSYCEDYMKDGKLIYRVETASGMGINCHRASRWKILEKVGLYSEGCVVHQNPYKYHDLFIPLVKQGAINYGNSFTFVMCDEEDFYD